MLFLSMLPVIVAATGVSSGVEKHFPELAERISGYRYEPTSGELTLQTDLDLNEVSPIFEHMAENPTAYDIGELYLAWVTDDLSANGPRLESARKLTDADTPGNVEVGTPE